VRAVLAIASVLALLSRAAHAEAPAAAVSALRRNDLGTALDLVKAHVAEHPNDVEANELLIDILSGLGLAPDAERYYSERATVTPSAADGWYLAGRAAVSAADSETRYRKALELAPGHARATMGLGSIARSKNALGEAHARYTEALAKDPSLTEAWAALVQVELQRGNRTAAADVARRSLAAVPGSPEPYLLTAALRPIEAVDVLSRGASAVPDEPKIQIALARAYVDREDWTNAAIAYDAALAISDVDPGVRIERGVAKEAWDGALGSTAAIQLLQARVDRSDAAGRLERLDAIVEGNPQSMYARLARGNLLADTARYDLAERDLVEALRLAPESAEALASLGVLYLNRGRAKEALPLLDKAAKARPGDPTLAIARATALAQLDARAGESALREAMARFPFESKIPVMLARLLVQVGNAQGAYLVLEAAAQRSPAPDVLLQWADVAERLGRFADEVRILMLLAATTGDERFATRAKEIEKRLAAENQAGPP
jgi:tetratricopeptide (TPR) repeat protein